MKNSATVYNSTTGEVIREVKNLGWLLRHWKQVERFEYLCYARPEGYRKYAGVMTAYLDNGTCYRTYWASNACANFWLDRPVFRGLPLKWIYQEITLDIKCGDRLTFR